MTKTTIRTAIDDVAHKLEASDIFYGHGTDNAWDEAVALVLQGLKIPFSVSDDDLQRELTDDEKAHIQNMLKRRIDDRVPLAYLTNEAYFFDMPFYVDERVIIPRSPIAELIENQFRPWVNPEKVNRILDLCTGSGCIAIACAMAFEYARVDAVDISVDALDVAKINVLKHEMEEQVNLIQSDLFTNVPNEKYDIIVSNPPYVSHEEMQTIPEEFNHEPNLALEANDEGLELAIKMLQQAADYLNDDGILVMEVGNSWPALEKRYPNVPFTWLEFEFGGDGVFLLDAASLRGMK